MTREEAIYWLEHGSPYIEASKKNYFIAIGFAIAALVNSPAEMPGTSDNCSEKGNSSADLIDRAEAQTELQFAARRYAVSHEANGECRVVWGDNLISVTDAMNALRKVPSAQPDIIACGDCKNWICHDRRCGYWNHGVRAIDWCSYAERITYE